MQVSGYMAEVRGRGDDVAAGSSTQCYRGPRIALRSKVPVCVTKISLSLPAVHGLEEHTGR